MKQNRVIKRAILSVSDKTGIIEFASELRNLGNRDPLHWWHLQNA